MQKFDIKEDGNHGKPVWNFSPGPCILPRAVLDKCAEEMIDYRGCGRSVMELAHRSPEFESIDLMTKAEIKQFLEVPDTHVVMLQQGGATMQYTGIVKNLIGLRPARKAMFMTTGTWSQQCITEARKFIPEDKLIEVTNLASTGFRTMTDPSTWKIDAEASYIHICMNETVHGIEIANNPNFPWHMIPKDVVVVGDCSSNLGSFHIDWNRMDVIYAGAQKNMGPSGTTIIIVRRDLLGHQEPDCPVLSDWTQNELNRGPQGHSQPTGGFLPGYYNTPPTYSIYVLGLNTAYMNQRGGVDTYIREAKAKSAMLWDLCDHSDGYYCIKMAPAWRSRMNCVFRIGDPVKGTPALEKKLQAEALKDKITNINGHVTNPGIRISSYNAMPITGVQHLCAFLTKFKAENPIPSAAAKM